MWRRLTVGMECGMECLLEVTINVYRLAWILYMFECCVGRQAPEFFVPKIVISNLDCTEYLLPGFRVIKEVLLETSLYTSPSVQR